MSDTNHTKTFSALLQERRQVVMPQIQRDYAQGRDSEREVRESFLSALYEALSLPAGDQRLPLNLDFIYGSMEDGDDKSFLPLDGQQRLTTLFLLHWYLAWRDKLLPQFRNLVWDGKHSRFSYQVRPNSTEFFDALVKFEPASEAEHVPSVKKLIEDQPWFFLYWRLDPTIQSAPHHARRHSRTLPGYDWVIRPARGPSSSGHYVSAAPVGAFRSYRRLVHQDERAGQTAHSVRDFQGTL